MDLSQLKREGVYIGGNFGVGRGGGRERGSEQKLMAATLGPHIPDPVLTTHHPALLRLCFIKKRID